MTQTKTLQPEQTARWYNRAGIWIGIGINPASITLGGGLASRLDVALLAWLVPLGVFLLWGIAVTGGIIGRRRRETFANWSTATFGVGVGAILINLVMALGMTGWSGFQLGLGGTALSHIIFLPQFGSIGVILMAGMVLYLGNLGVNRWNWFVWLTTTSAIGMAIFALFLVGFREPLPQQTEPFSVSQAFWVVGSIISFAVLFSLRCTDFTWDLATDRDVIYDGLCFAAVFSISLMIGVMLYRATGHWDLAIILADTPLALLGQLFLFVSLLAPALSTLHSGALAWSHVLPLKYWQGAALMIFVGMALGLLRFDQQLLGFLDWVGAILPPATAVLIISALQKRPVPHTIALVAWLAGAAVGVVFKLNDQIIHLAAGASTAILVLVIAQWVVRSEAAIQKKL